MALESTSFTHKVSDDTLLRVDILFDRDNLSDEIEAIKLLHPQSENEKADITEILLPYSSELMSDIDREKEEHMFKIYELIMSDLFDFND